MDSEVPSLSHLGSIPQSLFSGTLAVLVISWFSVLLRVYVRSVMLRSFGWDDWTIMLAITSFTAQCAFAIKAAVMEMDPAKNNNIQGVSVIVTDVVAFGGCYAITGIFLKISLGLFFLRVLVEPWQRIVVYICMMASYISGLIYFGIVTFGCGDPQKYLLRTVEHKCISIHDVLVPASYVHTAFNAIADWIMTLLPIFTIWNLSMPRMNKFWAYVLLALGAAGSVVSLIRFAYVEGIHPGRNFFTLFAKFALYSTIEPGLGITAVSFATLRPLVKRCLEGARSVSASHKSWSGGKTPPVVPDLQLKGLSMSRSRRGDGFQVFGRSEDEEAGWTEVHIVSNDLEKGLDGRWPHIPQPIRTQ